MDTDILQPNRAPHTKHQIRQDRDADGITANGMNSAAIHHKKPPRGIHPWRLVTFLPLFLALLVGCGERHLLSDVSFSSEHLSPNADRSGDVLSIQYRLSQSAELSIYFLDEAGNRYDFRTNESRQRSSWEPYTVLFAGIVDGYVLPSEENAGYSITRRVLQNGTYTWVIEASDGAGITEQETGTLVVEDADTSLPELLNLTVYPPVFTPNRDGISDRARINVWLTKNVDSLTVYLLDQDGVRFHVPEDEQSPARPNEPGLHSFDYDAGVDLGADPPPDGTYIVWAEARDEVGQHTVSTGTLTILNGGVPRGYIYNGEVAWSSEVVRIGETLHFTLTVENDSATPLRTGGPMPGTVYSSDENYATLGETIQSGAFRVGVGCEDSAINYPFRWAVGSADELEEDEQGYLYLPPFTSAVVTGGITFVGYVEAHNPQYCWAGLIHEDVEIALVNNQVSPVLLTIEEP